MMSDVYIRQKIRAKEKKLAYDRQRYASLKGGKGFQQKNRERARLYYSTHQAEILSKRRQKRLTKTKAHHTTQSPKDSPSKAL